MTVWEMMEMIHSRSYTYIIKNVYSDPTEVLEHITDNRKILDRAESVTMAYDEFINAAQEYGTGNLWKSDWKDSPTSQWTLRDLKRKLYRAVINVNILEGIRFYVSFACSFAFAELKLEKDPLKLSLSSPETKAASCPHSKHYQKMATGGRPRDDGDC